MGRYNDEGIVDALARVLNPANDGAPHVLKMPTRSNAAMDASSLSRNRSEKVVRETPARQVMSATEV